MNQMLQFSISDYRRLAENYRADNDSRAPFIQDSSSGYVVFAHNEQTYDGTFWQVQRADRQQTQNSGWKFHVSFDPRDMEQAWALASRHLINHEVGVFKVTSPSATERFSNPQSRQAGKFITVYDTGNPDALAHAMGQLEQIFTQHGIRPGPDVAYDRKVPGSQYFSYRNDQTAQGEYISSKDLASAPPQQAYNIAGRPDPWQGFRVIPPPPIAHVQATLANELHQSLNQYLPGAPIQQAQWNGQGYTVAISETYSRQQFSAAGLDPASLKRQPIGNGIHLVHIPTNALNAHYDPVKTRAGMSRFVNLDMKRLQQPQQPHAQPATLQSSIRTSHPRGGFERG